MSHKRNELTLEEYKKILVDALGFIHETCEKNRINYSLLGGSLIGAIRHKGMIPWDDDIDIVLDTKNYRKLIKVLANAENNKYKLLTTDTEKTYYYPYAKLVDTSTDVEEIGCKKIHDYGAYIDIFCYHNAPKTKPGKIIHYYKIQAYKIIFSGYAHKEIKKEYKYAFLKKLGKAYAEKIGIQKIIKHYNKLISKYDNKSSNSVISNWPVYGWKKEYHKKENLNNFLTTDFDKKTVKIYADYDTILKETYGDYMQLPPKEKRATHHTMIVRKKSAQKSLLSIVIPYHNSINNIYDCLQSLAGQTQSNFEVILVDDHSSDNTSSIINKVLRKNNVNYKIIANTAKQGAANARNSGISQATGDYITFIDSDDYIPSDFIENFNNIISTCDYDCICFDYFKIATHSKKQHKVISNRNYGLINRKDAFTSIVGSTWGKIYKTDIIKKHSIQFPDLQRKEDFPFTKTCISFCNKILYTNNLLYYYKTNNSSLMHNEQLLDENNSKWAFLYIRENCAKDLNEELKYLFAADCLYPYITILAQKGYSRKIILEKGKAIEQLCPDWKKYLAMKNISCPRRMTLFAYKHNSVTLIKAYSNAKKVIHA